MSRFGYTKRSKDNFISVKKNKNYEKSMIFLFVIQTNKRRNEIKSVLRDFLFFLNLKKLNLRNYFIFVHRENKNIIIITKCYARVNTNNHKILFSLSLSLNKIFII